MIRSPLNYTGGKFKLLPQIIKYLPTDSIDTFYDVFCGGFNVGINVPCNRIVAIDKMPQLIGLFQSWQSSSENLLDDLLSVKEKYNLTKTNREGYLTLREDYNENPDPLRLYSLITTSFNNNIRFNRHGKWNVPFGNNRSDFNPELQRRLVEFVKLIKEKDIEFICGDFETINLDDLKENDFIYCDPPYTCGLANYNESKPRWDKDCDLRLFNFLDRVNDRGVKFALSNLFQNRDTINEPLIEWSTKYKVAHLDKDYSNCCYVKTDRSKRYDEVLAFN